MIPDGWLDSSRCGEGQCSCSGKGRIIMGAFRYQAMMRCGYGAVHMVMRHGWASMMYRSWQVCVSSMMGGCSLDAGVRSREPGAREILSAFSVVSGVLEMEQVGKSRREFGRDRREFGRLPPDGQMDMATVRYVAVSVEDIAAGSTDVPQGHGLSTEGVGG